MAVDLATALQGWAPGIMLAADYTAFVYSCFRGRVALRAAPRRGGEVVVA